MSATTMGFIFTIFAGLSTLLGTIFIFIKVKKSENIIVASLSFAAGVMTTVSFADLIPESIHFLSKTFSHIPMILIILIFMVIGIIFSMLIDKYFPDQVKDQNGLYRVGIISMVAIIIHNIPEGIATFLATSADTTLGLSLAFAIALHNIPEGIAISVPLYYATGKRKKAFFYTVLSGISEPFGACLAFLFLSSFMNEMILGFLFSFIAGIMLQISFYELLPTARQYHKKKMVFFFFFLGSVFMIISHFLF